MNKQGIIQLFALLIISVSACAPADVNGPRGSKAVPPQVTVREVINIPGKSIIYYNLPPDGNIKYIKAVYSLRPGVKTETNMSYFTDSLIVEGFKNDGEYDVELYSVSTGGTFSEPVTVRVSPERPAYLAVGESASAEATFGGIKVTADNPVGDKLFIVIEKMGLTGEWERLTELITNNRKISITKRGLESVESYFRFTVEDRWGNITEPREFTLTPVFEKKLDKKLWNQVFGAGEVNYPHSLYSDFPHVWDEVIMAQDPECWNTAQVELPITVTIDLGVTTKLSRMEEWTVYRDITKYTRYSDWYEMYYDAGDIKDFEIYGSPFLDTDNPLFDAAGNQNPNWILLWAGTNERPSGLKNCSSIDLITEEEAYNYANGVPRNFDLSQSAPPVKYLKLRILSNWGGAKYITIQEITLYGQS